VTVAGPAAPVQTAARWDVHAPTVRLLHSLPGRARFHLSRWDGRSAAALDERLRSTPGIERARFTPASRNALVFFDRSLLDTERLREILERILDEPIPAGAPTQGHGGPRERPYYDQAIVHATTRLAASGAALGLLVISQLLGMQGRSRRATQIAGWLSVLQGNPFVREALRRRLGPVAADAALALPSIAALALARSPIGLALAAADALRLFTDSHTVRAGCRRHEEQNGGTMPDQSGRTARRRHGSPQEPALRWLGTLSLGHAVAVGLATRSMGKAYAALLLVNGRAAMVGEDAAETGARARLVRMRATVLSDDPGARLPRPTLLLLGTTRLLTNGLEIAGTYPLDPMLDDAGLLRLSAAASETIDALWSDVFRGQAGRAPDGDDTRYTLQEVRPRDRIPRRLRRSHRSHRLLALRPEGERRVLGVIALRPRIASGVEHLAATCRRHRIALEAYAGEDPGAADVARRAGVRLARGVVLSARIRTARARGAVVGFASDSADQARALAASDLAIGFTGSAGRSAPAADLAVPDPDSLAGVVDSLVRRDRTVRTAVLLAVLSNLAGVFATHRAERGRIVSPADVASLAILAWSRYGLRGGDPRWRQVEIADPHPERWGQHEAAWVLAHFRSSERGLTSKEAAARRVVERTVEEKHPLLQALLAEARSPLIALLAAGGVMALMLGSPGDVVVILLTLAVNIGLGGWQNHRASRLALTLKQVGEPVARVLRDGRSVMVPPGELVPGDILELRAGDRVAADARLVVAEALEVDEAALTGESFPVAKWVEGANGAAVVLAGTDVTAGTALAVAVGVGRESRMGAMAAALAHDEVSSTLGTRLAQLVHLVVPIVVAGGLLVVVAGVLWGQPLGPQIALGLSIALAAFPEGLPLMAAVGQAAAARRLMRSDAFVRRTGAIEGLGRVDVACVDKTGTLTEGRLAVRVISTFDADVALPAESLDPDVRRVLLTAALASPPPGSERLAAHATDIVIIRAARACGLDDALHVRREAEAAFSSTRGFHGSRVDGRVVVKGAFENVLSRCTTLARGEETVPLDSAGHERLLDRVQDLAARGLRVLLVADGEAGTSLDDPENLRAVGAVALADPLRDAVPGAVRRCQEAGIKVLMLTGDHPLTARVIADEAGLLGSDAELTTAAELNGLTDEELGARLEHITVIARATPLEKLRIVAGLQRAGHTVAMTGDGINDAPALRLADVGVAMGRGGTEVARQAADLVLGQDDFTALVQALVEGRGFWHNIRRALGLLLGGNLGELAVVTAAAVLGRAVPLTVRQILATNLITDALPALAVVTQPPENRPLAALAREGSAALDRPLRADIMVRAAATAAPTTAAYLLGLRGGLAEGRTVAFASIVATQLAQTVLAGWREGTLTRPVALAVVASGGAAVLLLAPGLRQFFELTLPSAGAWVTIALASLAAPPLSELLRRLFLTNGAVLRLPAAPKLIPLPA
jgi:cation-transporting P-type ATPase I